MAFCTECGHQLAEGAKFCFECGAKVNAPSSPRVEQRKTVYDGEIHRCPNCGDILDAYESVCETCGYERRGTKATSSVQELARKLEAIESQRPPKKAASIFTQAFTQGHISKTDEQKINLIQSFPIPNTKEDVMEFMLLAINNISGTNSSDIRIAWQAKLDQIHQKASMILPEADMAQVNALYEETSKKVRTHDIVQGTKATGKAVGHVATGLGSALLWIVKQLPAVLMFVAKNILSLLGLLRNKTSPSRILRLTTNLPGT